MCIHYSGRDPAGCDQCISEGRLSRQLEVTPGIREAIEEALGPPMIAATDEARDLANCNQCVGAGLAGAREPGMPTAAEVSQAVQNILASHEPTTAARSPQELASRWVKNLEAAVERDGVHTEQDAALRKVLLHVKRICVLIDTFRGFKTQYIKKVDAERDSPVNGDYYRGRAGAYHLAANELEESLALLFGEK